MSREGKQRILALLGILGPIIYAVLILVFGYLTPEYNHLTQVVSVLGSVGAPYAMFMNIGFMLLGIFIIAFSFALYYGSGASLGTNLILMAGISMIAVGFLPCDTGCVNTTFIGTFHSFNAYIPGILMVLAPIVIAFTFKDDVFWRRFWIYSLLTGIITAVFSMLFIFNFSFGMTGLIQRIIMFLPLLWMFLISIKLFRSAKQQSSQY